MQIKEIMTNNVVSVSPNMTLLDCAKEMQKYDIGVLPVEDNENPVGIITDRDIILRCVATGRDANTLKVGDVMTTGMVSVSPTQSANDAAEIMSDKQIRRLPVVEQGKIVGIVSLGDVAKIREFKTEVGSALCDICEPGQMKRKKTKG